ncbi:MAG: helix-turn-helix domain-containing protein [Phycisphaerales bacterium]|nr:helix-turn-helix domain-containing protein [Phycisphaerales bacterium]
MTVKEAMGGLLTVRDVAGVLRISSRQVQKLRASGRIPAPVKLARSTRWRADEIQAWVQAGCPAADEWTARKGAPRG